jgi:4-diphosphocytidyl-2-C-methyl-D-erythritol kinase
MFDDLQPGVMARHPQVAHAIATLCDAGAAGAILTGSGPTVVALASSPAEASRLAAAVPSGLATSGPPPHPPG